MSNHEKISVDPGSGAEAAHVQYAALCWRMHGGTPEILLITSRDTGRWVVPKGWPVNGRSPHGSAAVEAWEEAGVEGRVEAESLGTFTYPKLYPDADPQVCMVKVFSLRVEKLASHYPEYRQRRRKWFSAEKAARKVAEPELRALIRDFRGAQPASRKAEAGA